jgi:hypothetical protein
VGGYKLRLVGLIENPSISSNSSYENVGLGFFRSYLTSLGGKSALVQGSKLSEWRFLLSRPDFRRLFSSESPDPKKSMHQF